MFKKKGKINLNDTGFLTFQITALVVLRVAIGWHFLYEGIVKLMNPNWSSAGYLLDSKGWFEGIFQSMAMNPQVLKIVDLLNMWGLTAIGLGLILGFLTKISIVSGMILLLFYYASHPALIAVEYLIPNEGSYLIINKTIIEILALWVLFQFSGADRIGIDRFLWKKNSL